MSLSAIKVGDYINIKDSIEVPDGRYEVVETRARSSRMLARRQRPSRICVMAPSKRDPSWKPAGWWVEDSAIDLGL